MLVSCRRNAWESAGGTFGSCRRLRWGLRGRSFGLVDDAVDGCGFFVEAFIGSRQGIGNEVCLTLDIANVRRVFGNARQLIRLSGRLRIGFFRERRNE